jgi:secreted trypsin-like serine protease
MLGRGKRLGALVAATVVAGIFVVPGAHAAPRIVGGNPSPPHAYPFIVALAFSDAPTAYDGQYCAGDLISDRLVVTAAHCAAFLRSAREIDVLAGAYDLTVNDFERIKVNGIAVNPAYDEATAQNDVAILRLETPTTLGRPVDLAGPLDAPLLDVGRPVRAVGWGMLHDPVTTGGAYFPNRLFEVDMNVTSDLDCEKAFGHAYIPASMICAAAPGKGTCFGDSGGPLLAQDNPARWVLAGITSWGQNCGQTGFPSVFGRVAALRSFIAGDHVFAPYNLAPPVITGTPRLGQQLTCSPGTWANAATSFTYEWLRRFPVEGVDEPIPGATTGTYTVVAADAGQQLVCVVTGINAGGKGVAESAPVDVPR